MSSDFSGSDEPDGDLFILHEAAEAGDAEALRQLLEQRTQHLQQQMDVEDADAAPLLPNDDPYLQAKDQAECTPLHVAILHGHVECAELLICAKASVAADCDGCPCLHLATCCGALPGREAAALQLVERLLQAGADPLQRDDSGRLALHWAAELGLTDVCRLLLAATADAAAALTARVAAAAAEADSGATAPELDQPNLLEMQDNNGDNVLHVAARFNQAGVLQLLLSSVPPGEDTTPTAAAIAAAAEAKNKQTFTPLAVAAHYGAAAALPLLLKAHPAAAAAASDKKNLRPAQLAERRGHAALAALLNEAAPASSSAADGYGGDDAAAAAAGGVTRSRTLIVAPPECELHRTCPDPLPRGCQPPPENVERLRVLVAPGRGILQTTSFAGRLAWERRVQPAPVADVLRVHDWNYVRGLQLACQAIPDTPAATAHLDPDTAVSHHTFHVALRAAAAVCLAVDRVVTGAAANAFCAVRPPGHHAGPRGVVPSKKDRAGSHGFCLLNNVAIGAAYAMNVHRHAGIQRVAILDFDVHHGNGTRACVANTAPGSLRVPFSTPLSEGVHVYHTYAPWFDVDDDDNVMFASVQGYGPKSAGMPDVYVYPGSGATCDTQELKQQLAHKEQQQQQHTAAAAEAGTPNGAAPGPDAVKGEIKGGPDGDAAAAAPAPAPAADEDGSHLIEEDPDHEFPSTTADDPVLAGPRVIEVGIPGPGFHPLLWRRAWRDKVLPALVNFNPDLILISAGFDAHRKDEINFRYIGVTEADYEWLTDQIVQVANRCCGGRIVSVLEGGYNINGGLVSAFARSVAAHVRGLAEPHTQVWDPVESQQERVLERRRREERAAKLAAKKAAALARLKAAEAAARAAAGEAAAAAAAGGDNDRVAAAGEAETAAAAAAVAVAVEGAGGEGRAKRRRTAPVDYAALNAKLEAEAAAAGERPAAEL